MKKITKPSTKGFTLIELLAVFVILSIILGIAIVGYNRYINISRNRAYKIAEEAMQVAASNTLTDCMTSSKEDMGNFCDVHKAPATQYEYDVITGTDLVKYNYIDPIVNPDDTDEYCDMENSYVYISNKANSEEENNNDFVYKVCLRCGDRKSKECRDDVLDQQTTTWGTTCQVYYDEEGSLGYDGKWTDQDLYLKFASSGDYKYGINQYKYNPGNKWYSVPAKDDIATARLTETVDDKTIRSEAYDGLNQKATAVCTNAGGDRGTKVKIDKTKMEEVVITASLTDNQTEVFSDMFARADDGKVVLTANPDPATTPSGYYYTWYKDGVKIDGETEKTYIATSKGIYRVEVTNGVGKQKVTSSNFIVKIDKNKPTCTLVAEGQKSSLLPDWYISDVTISVSGFDDLEDDNSVGSGVRDVIIDQQYVTHDGENIVITGTVTDYAGRTNTCEITVNKDNQPPLLYSKDNPKLLGTDDYDFKNNVDAIFGPAGGDVTCIPDQSLKTGFYSVTCTGISATTGQRTDAFFNVQHSYPAVWEPNLKTVCSCHAHTSDCPSHSVWVDWVPGVEPYWGGVYDCNNLPKNSCCSRKDYGKYVCPNGGEPIGDICYY